MAKVNLSDKLKSKEIKKAPVNVAKPSIQSSNNMGKSGSTLSEVKKVSGKTLAGAVIEGARNSVKSKPLGNPKDAKTTVGKVARAVGNTAIKTVTAPMETATNIIGAGISTMAKGKNTQSDRRAGSIYKSSDKEISSRKAAQADTGSKTKGFNYKLAKK